MKLELHKERYDLSQYRRAVHRYKTRTLTEYYDRNGRRVAFTNESTKLNGEITRQYAPEIVGLQSYRDGNGY